MSVKRQATTELNHENWDQDDPSEQEDESGGFKMATKEVLEKRVIRTAKRRSTATGDDTKKGIFSGFGGFNKTQPSSFDFLSNLTNGNKNNATTPTSKSDTAVSSSSVSTKPANSPSSGIFSLSGTSTPKASFGKPQTETSLFGGISTTSTFSSSVFTTSKPDSTVNDSPFKIQSTFGSYSPDAGFSAKQNTNADKPISQVSSTIFGVPSANAPSKSLFSSTTTSNSTLFQTQPVPSTASKSQEAAKPENKPSDSESKMDYYNKLKGLNESVSDWIKKHVEETPLCILTPIFKDYEKYLKEIQDEYETSKEKSKNDSSSANNQSSNKKNNNTETKNTSTLPASNSLFSANNTKSPKSVFSLNTNNPISTPEKSSTFAFANSTTTASASTFSASVTPTAGFSFGAKTSSPSASPFAASPATTTANSNGSAPFSFGIGKPFSFNSNIKNDEPAKPNEVKEDEDEPPKVEYTPIVEENSVYDKKCKIFVKKDGNFIDKGVGTLYIKKIEDSGKHQLLVRANTTLGNVLLNMILGSSIPTQRMGKNNVMMVCIPTPDAKPPPTSILIRVKTSEEADELLETLNKYKA